MAYGYDEEDEDDPRVRRGALPPPPTRAPKEPNPDDEDESTTALMRRMGGGGRRGGQAPSMGGGGDGQAAQLVMQGADALTKAAQMAPSLGPAIQQAISIIQRGVQSMAGGQGPSRGRGHGSNAKTDLGGVGDGMDPQP